jgi:hypothetical protein
MTINSWCETTEKNKAENKFVSIVSNKQLSSIYSRTGNMTIMHLCWNINAFATGDWNLMTTWHITGTDLRRTTSVTPGIQTTAGSTTWHINKQYNENEC